MEGAGPKMDPPSTRPPRGAEWEFSRWLHVTPPNLHHTRHTHRSNHPFILRHPSINPSEPLLRGRSRHHETQAPHTNGTTQRWRPGRLPRPCSGTTYEVFSAAAARHNLPFHAVPERANLMGGRVTGQGLVSGVRARDTQNGRSVLGSRHF
ncbi:hypothetical protein CSOJ01_01520 [Colletotrichum sojae]|uniref:Uncharacterized protein n=1 Tax=Colletotrichum sojae TaxID=2175907 RepID=A0A8H6JUN9_9PEZI|nr:hypothetical protein CSOJ01_01520 [Colletotrichum sojae]